MAKFNSLRKLFAPDAINRMGEECFTLSDRESLVSRVMTTFLSAATSRWWTLSTFSTPREGRKMRRPTEG